MNKVMVFGFLILFFCIVLLTQMDLIIANTTNTDNKDALDRSSKVAISKSINKGTLRVNEEIEIDPERVKTAFKEAYEKSAAFKDKQAKRNFTIETIQSKPAMIAVKGEALIGGYSNKFRGTEDKPNRSIEKYIVIYEAKQPIKQLGGNVK